MPEAANELPGSAVSSLSRGKGAVREHSHRAYTSTLRHLQRLSTVARMCVGCWVDRTRRGLCAKFILALALMAAGSTVAHSQRSALLFGPSERVEGWHLQCVSSAVTAWKHCSASKGDVARGAARQGVTVAFVRGEDGVTRGPLVEVPHDWPIASVQPAARVDENPGRRWRMSDPAAGRALIAQMLRGRAIRAEFGRWPECESCYAIEVDLTGFKVVYDAVVALARREGLRVP